MTGNDLENILSRRAVEPPATNLSSRIVEATKPREAGSFSGGIWNDIMTMFVLPKPAYVLSACLIIGLFIGALPEQDHVTATQDLFSFIEVQEDNWL
jgi:hypothetical protein